MSQENCLVRSLVNDPVSLESLGREISEKHTAFGRYSLEHAKRVGELLLLAKEEVKKQSKGWQEWRKIACPAISERTARLYVQVAKNWDYLAATVAVENFSLKDAQKALNAQRSNKQSPSEPDYVADLKRSLDRTEESLDLFLQNDNDWNSYNSEALLNMSNALATLESRIAQARNKLSNHLRSQSANCPSCNNDLLGMESCIHCSWNAGQLTVRDCLLIN